MEPPILRIKEEEEEGMVELPPGFRFHPTDEELVTHYLSKKISDGNFVCRAIGDIDLNKCEPWDLPRMAKMGEKEWYFFCVRDRKYPTGLRTNRATEAGYWKATGKDKEVHRAKMLVGMKKTLVFYTGRAPKGGKTNWVMHEYRSHPNSYFHAIPKTDKNEWVICRVFQKSLVLDKIYRNEMDHPLAPLMNTNFAGVLETAAVGDATHHVSCFSNVMEGYFFTAPNNNHVDCTALLDLSGGGDFKMARQTDSTALKGDPFIWYC